MTQPRTVRVPLPPDETLRAAEEAVELWGGRWEAEGSGGRVTVPVQAGLRSGVLRGRISLFGTEGSSRLELHVEDVRWRLHGSAVAILLIAFAGSVALVAWPWFPALEPFLGLGLVLAVAAWFLVVARLQNRGPDELLATVTAMAGTEES